MAINASTKSIIFWNLHLLQQFCTQFTFQPQIPTSFTETDLSSAAFSDFEENQGKLSWFYLSS